MKQNVQGFLSLTAPNATLSEINSDISLLIASYCHSLSIEQKLAFFHMLGVNTNKYFQSIDMSKKSTHTHTGGLQ